MAGLSSEAFLSISCPSLARFPVDKRFFDTPKAGTAKILQTRNKKGNNFSGRLSLSPLSLFNLSNCCCCRMLQKIMTLKVFFIIPNKNWGQKTAGKKVFSYSFLIAELRQIESGDAKRKSWSIFGYFSPIHGERKTRLQLGNNFFGYAFLVKLFRGRRRRRCCFQ